MGKNYSKVGIILELNNEVHFVQFVDFFLSRTLLRRYKSSKVESSLIQDIKMAAGFGGVRHYFG